MTTATEAQPKGRKRPKNFAERMLTVRDRLAARVPSQDWEAVPNDASLKLETYTEGKL
jgi:hypothetical protein